MTAVISVGFADEGRKQIIELMRIIPFLMLLSFSIPTAGEEEKKQMPKPVKLSKTRKLPEVDPKTGEGFLPSIAEGKKWKLVWSDEFDGNAIDSSKWNILGDHKRKDGWWLKEDARLDGNGSLEIRVKKQGDRYTTGGINTKGKFERRFGYFVARCRFTGARGHGPAFWLQSREAASPRSCRRRGPTGTRCARRPTPSPAR